MERSPARRPRTRAARAPRPPATRCSPSRSGTRWPCGAGTWSATRAPSVGSRSWMPVLDVKLKTNKKIVLVCAVQVKNTGKMYACKKLDKKRLKKKKGEQMALLEKEILEKVNSPFIVTLAYAFESKSHLCLVMSLMNGGDLKYHIYHVGERGLEISRIVFYSAQITCGILHLHSIGIVYRDMKPENVLLDDRGHCRLSDLGLAVQIKDGKPITQRAGTNGYMAPEILKEEESYSYPVDWFAMGCSIYEMVAGRTPFKDYKEKVSKEDLKQRTLTQEVKFQHPGFTEEAKEVCRLFLAKKAEQRLGSSCLSPVFTEKKATIPGNMLSSKQSTSPVWRLALSSPPLCQTLMWCMPKTSAISKTSLRSRGSNLTKKIESSLKILQQVRFL